MEIAIGNPQAKGLYINITQGSPRRIGFCIRYGNSHRDALDKGDINMR